MEAVAFTIFSAICLALAVHALNRVA